MLHHAHVVCCAVQQRFGFSKVEIFLYLPGAPGRTFQRRLKLSRSHRISGQLFVITEKRKPLSVAWWDACRRYIITHINAGKLQSDGRSMSATRWASGWGNIVVFSKISKISYFLYIGYFRFFWYFRFFRYIYRAFAHTLLKLYEIYYQMRVCTLHIRWSTLVIHTALHHTALLCRGAIWQKLSNTEQMLRAQLKS